jgi:hypothetical protein
VIALKIAGNFNRYLKKLYRNSGTERCSEPGFWYEIFFSVLPGTRFWYSRISGSGISEYPVPVLPVLESLVSIISYFNFFILFQKKNVFLTDIADKNCLKTFYATKVLEATVSASNPRIQPFRRAK